ncbi:MAG: DUF4332 domain-containing protein [Spirulinaceae cyanobacterium]
MAHQIEDIDGITPFYVSQLEKANINTVEELLEKGKSVAGRRELSQAAGIEEGMIFRWLHLADLIQIKGVGGEYSKLLEASGVDSVEKLGQVSPNDLYEEILRVNEQLTIVKLLPSFEQIINWISQAKERPVIIEEESRYNWDNNSEWSIEWAD